MGRMNARTLLAAPDIVPALAPAQVGGKAANLARLQTLQQPVPPWYVDSSTVASTNAVPRGVPV